MCSKVVDQRSMKRLSSKDNDITDLRTASRLLTYGSCNGRKHCQRTNILTGYSHDNSRSWRYCSKHYTWQCRVIIAGHMSHWSSFTGRVTDCHGHLYLRQQRKVGGARVLSLPVRATSEYSFHQCAATHLNTSGLCRRPHSSIVDNIAGSSFNTASISILNGSSGASYIPH